MKSKLYQRRILEKLHTKMVSLSFITAQILRSSRRTDARYTDMTDSARKYRLCGVSHAYYSLLHKVGQVFRIQNLI